MHLSELTLSGGQLSALGDEDGFRRQGGQDLDSAGSANHRFSVARACWWSAWLFGGRRCRQWQHRNVHRL